MERAGVLVDLGVLDELGREMAKELAVLEEKARQAAGQDLNLASPRQLETVLFDELELRVIKKTKTGRSTDAEVLEALADKHPLPKVICEFRDSTSFSRSESPSTRSTRSVTSSTAIVARFARRGISSSSRRTCHSFHS